jgi:predicted metalloprotease with PDZ domain
MSLVRKSALCWLTTICLISTAAFSQTQAPTISVAVDATQAPRKIFHAEMKIPASAGTLPLYYPKWIPGEHGPTGPIQDLTGLKFTANGQELKWRRDLLDGWTIHVEVPAAVTTVQAALDFASPAGKEGEGIYTGGASATDKMTVLNWNTVLLYPKGWTSDDLKYEASLRLPNGWKFGTSLAIASQAGSEIRFAQVSLTSLVDSPVIAGEYLRVVPLANNPQTEMDIAADSAAALDAPGEVFSAYQQLVEQAQKLFGAHHYRDYHFLYSLSDHVAHCAQAMAVLAAGSGLLR